MKLEDDKQNDGSDQQVSVDNKDEIVCKGQDAATDIVCKVIKGLDANRYATKKTVAQGMLDIALLTSNASQLKYVLQVGPKHEFYMLLIVLISTSIVLQVAMGFVLLSLNLLRDCWFHKPRHRTSALNINYATTATAFILLVGLLFVVIGGLDLNDHDDQPSAIILNDIIVIFIFVISVINIVVSAIVALMLGFIFNINHQPDHRKAELLNNISLAFKVISITVNVIISIFYSMEVDSNAGLLPT